MILYEEDLSDAELAAYHEEQAFRDQNGMPPTSISQWKQADVEFRATFRDVEPTPAVPEMPF